MKLYIGINSGATGTDNQTKALIDTLGSKAIKSRSIIFDSPSLDLFVENPRAFRKQLKASLDNLYTQHLEYPKLFVLPFIQGNAKLSFAYVAETSKYIKEYYKHKGIPAPKTAVLNCPYPSKENRCLYIDVINVGEHMMSTSDRKDLANNQFLKDKIIITTGVPGSITDEVLKAEAQKHADELKKFQDGKSVALFTIGGRDELNNVRFSIDDAKRIMTRAEEIRKQGWHVILTNSPRTPTDVTDYLYEEAQKKDMHFYNAKTVIEPGKHFSAAEKDKNFRIYDGKYNDEFREQAAKIGNIYRAAISLVKNGGLYVSTMDSFSYTSDAAVLGIKTAVYSGVSINRERLDCKRLYDICCKRGYIVDLETTPLLELLDGKPLAKLAPVTKQIADFVISKGLSFIRTPKMCRIKPLKKLTFNP